MKKTLANYSMFLTATVLLWIKTYFVSKFYFNIPLENKMQQFILLISPISTVLLFFGFTLFFSGKARNRMILFISFIGSIILYANIVFYRFFNDFITIPVLFQTSNMGDLGSSIFELINVTDIVFFIDVIILVVLMKFISAKPGHVTKKQVASVFAAALALFAVNLGLAETERPQLLTRTFDREMLIKNIGVYNYHIYDIFMQSRAQAQRALADSSEIVDIENYVKANRVKPNENFTGIAKDKNVFVIVLESTQDFVINNTVDGEVITPFLNELITESYYFPNFYHQTGQGKTSDSEFLLENSLYPLPSGAVFFTHSQNEYDGMPKKLKEEGYYTSVFHANNKSFWNRDVMYDTLGYDRFYDVNSFNVTEENSIGWGLKDDDFFQQSIKYVKNLPQPFYTKYITLTNHFPFTLDEEDQLIPPWDSNSGTLNRYFTTVRYMDEAVKNFFERIKEEGLYEDSIFILYGDHYGISENHNKAMSQFLEKEVTPFESAQLQKVPFIIHIPGHEGKVIDTVGGQIDMKPTILNLLGIDARDQIYFGNDLFSEERSDFAVFRDGSFITKDYVYTKNICYDKATGLETEMEHCEPYKEKSETHLDLSDRIIYGDLLRFFNKEEQLLLKNSQK
ncbi:LTA synthase family protein [Pueribacillus sp. YX66]|uniref:LTA synthase family protein n=1 Tax=Pueribacillus sp. YX66 TaxID=3229242 RepID=UPI00358D78F4